MYDVLYVLGLTHYLLDGGVGEVFESTKHFWSLRGKQWLQPNPIQLTPREHYGGILCFFVVVSFTCEVVFTIYFNRIGFGCNAVR